MRRLRPRVAARRPNAPARATSRPPRPLASARHAQQADSARVTHPPPPPPPPRVCASLTWQLRRFAEQLAEHEGDPATTAARAAAIGRAEAALARVDARARLHLFGSTVFGQRLPYGDTDVMVDAPGVRSDRLLAALSDALRTSADPPSSLLLRTTARVPSLKWTDAPTGVKLDLCANVPLALRASAAIVAAAAVRPQAAPVALALKSLLLQHGLHQSYNGGVGGYLLANMVHHVALTPPPPPSPPPPPERAGHRGGGAAAAWEGSESGGAEAEEDPGGLLLRTLWYYGHALDPSHTIVLVDASSSHVADGPESDGWADHKVGALSLRDAAGGRDAGAGAYRWGSARALIRGVYARLASEIGASASASERAGRGGGEEEWPEDDAAAAGDADRGGDAGAEWPAEGWAAPASPEVGAPRIDGPRLATMLPGWSGRFRAAGALRCQRGWAQISRRRWREVSALSEMTAGLRDGAGTGGAPPGDPVWSGAGATVRVDRTD